MYRFQTDDTISFYVHSSQDDNRQITKEDRAQIESEMKAVIQKETEQGNILTVGVSRIHDGLMELFQARNECVRYIFMTNAELDIQEDEHELGRVEVDAKLPYLEIEHLFQEISAGNTEGIAEEVRKAYEPAKAYIAADVKDYASLITFLIILRIYQMQAKVDPELEVIRHNQLDIKRIEREYPTLENQIRLAAVSAEKLAGAVAKQGVGSGKKIIQEALDYIEQHFCENISLADVADAISISKNYLANLFKKELDITLINYVTNLRIEEAKRLLRQGNLKMYEVAGAVGYNDYAYFSQLFKKHTGVTLSAYKSSAI
ncbi:MAG: helix-turn-helix domain-containing protein [Eubacterium sp.]|nr:helix-turn-helix domain-containing protein [Eubacterium sp.]